MVRLALFTALTLAATAALAADKPLYQSDPATIAARIRASYKDENPFAGARVVNQMFREEISVNGRMVARQAILDALDKEIATFRKAMPDFRIEDRFEIVADNGIVMTGRMVGNGAGGKAVDTAFVTIFKRDETGRIVSQTTFEAPAKKISGD
jgi:hypothetical protein